MNLIILQPFSSPLGEEISPLKRLKRLHPLTHSLRRLIIEQPIKHIAVALPRGPVFPESLGDILPECHGCVRHNLKIHYAFNWSRGLARPVG